MPWELLEDIGISLTVTLLWSTYMPLLVYGRDRTAYRPGLGLMMIITTPAVFLIALLYSRGIAPSDPSLLFLWHLGAFILGAAAIGLIAKREPTSLLITILVLVAISAVSHGYHALTALPDVLRLM